MVKSKTRLCLQYTASQAAVTQAPQYKGMIGKKNFKRRILREKADCKQSTVWIISSRKTGLLF